MRYWRLKSTRRLIKGHQYKSLSQVQIMTANTNTDKRITLIKKEANLTG
jgi:hypothetical protein